LLAWGRYKEFTEAFKARAVDRPPYYTVPESVAGAPFWFEPTEVWELQGAELTVSPNYFAAHGANSCAILSLLGVGCVDTVD
jgi:ATP-dependent DNA ligase